MDQTECQKFINQIERQARDAVYKWADGKNEPRCSGCIEDRVQFLAEYVIEGALSFAADEHAVEEQVDEVMALCDESDKAFEAEQAAQEALVHEPADFLKDDLALLKDLLETQGPDTPIAHYHRATGTKTMIPLSLYVRLATEAQAATQDGAK